MFQQECLCGWKAHIGEVFNVQFSSDETSVYSIGRDNSFCKWGINRSGEKIAEFKIHEHASNPTAGRLKGEYYPDVPRGNLFAFESEDKFVLTCGPQEAIIYQVCISNICFMIYLYRQKLHVHVLLLYLPSLLLGYTAGFRYMYYNSSFPNPKP